MTPHERGTWVTMHTESGSRVEGWLAGESQHGYLIATTLNLGHLQLIRHGAWTSMSYDHEHAKHPQLFREDARELEQRMYRLQAAMHAPLDRAFRRLDYRQLAIFAQASTELRRSASDIDELENNLRIRRRSRLADLLAFLVSKTDSALRLHSDVLIALEDSGLLDVLQEHSEELTHMPRELTLPATDLEVQPESELLARPERDSERWSIIEHKSLLDIALDQRNNVVAGSLGRASPESTSERTKKESDATPLSRWVAPTMRVIAGTGLASANAALGITAGLTATLTTLGATAVPVYVGVATSIYTGITQVADGLEKIGRSK